jgi:hypothetical protein
MPFVNTLPAPFQVTPVQTAIAIAYRNESLIADAVLPRVQVDTPAFNYSIRSKADMFSQFDSKVGRKSAVNEIDWTATLTSAFVDDHALDEVVPRRDQAVAQAYGNFIDPKMIATEEVAAQLANAREARAAALVFNAASYATGNKTTLTGTAAWSDKVNSDPLLAMMTAMDGMVMRPTQVVFGRQVWTAVRTHPKIVAAWHGNAGGFGMVSSEFVAQLLEVDEVLIGDPWINTAKKGQAVTLARVWGNYCAMLYKKPVSISTESMSFGITAQWGARIAGTYFDEKKGMRGSDVVRVGESVKELIMANDLGYLFTTPV